MFKIFIRQSPLFKHFEVQWGNCCKTPLSMNCCYKNNIKLGPNYNREHRLRTKHFFAVCSYVNSSVNLDKTRSLVASSSNILRPSQTLTLQQKRCFSFQSSIQSFNVGQAGLFKTLSESTPVEYCQSFLVNFHAFTGLPWWASIILSTILIRSVVTLPLAIYQQSIVARLENLKLEMPDIANELKNEIGVAIRMYNWDEKTARINYNRSIRKQWNNLIIRDNCHPLKTTVLLWVQLPLWVCLSISYRNLVYMLPHSDLNAQLTFAELMGGGFGVIPNLTIPDGSWIFPVALGLLNLAIIEMQMLSRNPDIKPSKVQKIFTNGFRVLSLCMVPIAASVPSCLVLYWTTSSAFGLCQNLVLLSPKVKRLLRIPKTVMEVKEPYKMIVTNFKSKLKM